MAESTLSSLGSRARREAQRRLIARHQGRYDVLLRQERLRRGLPAVAARWSTR